MAASIQELSQFQRIVQQALSSDRPGLAGPAAQRINACVNQEALAPQMRALAEEKQRERPSAGYGEFVSFMDHFHAACQGLDAATRAQLEPLIRRSLGEGDRGAAASLVGHLGKAFDPAREARAVAALKRDAWACDLGSASALESLYWQHRQLLTPPEWAAVSQLHRSRPMLGQAWRPPQIASTPPADAFSAEVDGILAAILPFCEKRG